MKAYRSVLGLSQEKLAEKVGTSTHYIGMIETKNKFPSPEMLIRIATALGIDTVQLFSIEIDFIEAVKTHRKMALEDIKAQLGQYIDEKLLDIARES
jgi:transcriptional regulator with XRE-family HTH domain